MFVFYNNIYPTVVLLFAYTGVTLAGRQLAWGKQNSMHIYLLIGQSNMAGRADLPGPMMEEILGVSILSRQNVFDSASNPLNRYSSLLNVKTTFDSMIFSSSTTKALNLQIIGISSLVVNAQGGTSIWLDGCEVVNLRRTHEMTHSGAVLMDNSGIFMASLGK